MAPAPGKLWGGGHIGSPGASLTALHPETRWLRAGLTYQVGERKPLGAERPHQAPDSRGTRASLAFRRRRWELGNTRGLNGRSAGHSAFSQRQGCFSPHPTCPLAFAESPYLHHDNGPAPESGAVGALGIRWHSCPLCPLQWQAGSTSRAHRNVAGPEPHPDGIQ